MLDSQSNIPFKYMPVLYNSSLWLGVWSIKGERLCTLFIRGLIGKSARRIEQILLVTYVTILVS